jgi:hypothetical protein
MQYFVNCTTKHSTYERITHLGCRTATGLYQRFTEEEVLKRMRAGDEFLVQGGGHTVKVIEAEHEGRVYLKTERDGIRPDNLLAQPHCTEKSLPTTPPVRTTPAGSHSV